MGVTEFGWTEERAAPFGPWAEEGLVPGRVVRQARDLAVVVTDEGEVQAEVSGRFRRTVVDAGGFPAVGDWVAVRLVGEGRAVVEAVLPRHGVFARKAAGGVAEAQVVAANVDVVFLVTGLDGDFSVRRIERYVTTGGHDRARRLRGGRPASVPGSRTHGRGAGVLRGGQVHPGQHPVGRTATRHRPGERGRAGSGPAHHDGP